jgi:DNA-directed RNA polymerase subunit beta'
MLGKLDTEAVYQEAYKIAEGADRDKDRSRAYRTLRTVKMLKDAGMKPQEAFMRKQVLVLPANIRGLRRDDKTGDFVIGDLNYLYRDIGLIDQSLRAARTQNMPPQVIAGIESGLYDSMRALLQTEGSGSLSGADYQGILGILAGRRPDSKTGKDISDVKQSYFKKNLMQRRQIMSARTVLTPDGEIGMDQVGIPRRVAVGIFEPLMEAEYKRINPNYNVGMQSERFKEFREAMKDYRDQNKANPIVDRVLDRVAQDRWVAVKRDPALHKFSVQGFQPVLTRQKTINLNPLVYQGFNADNDGDTLAIYAPVSQQASNELREVMRPSANLFNLASHNVEHTLSHEAILGLSRMTKSPIGEKPKAAFKDSDDAYRAFLKDEVEYDDLVTIGGKNTTLGQARIDKHLPVGLKIDDLRTSGVFGASFGDVGMSKKDVQKLVERIAIDKPTEFGKVVNDIRREASTASTLTSASMRLRDLKPILPELRKVVEAEIVKEIEAMPKNLSSRDEQDYLKDVYTRHLSRLDKEADILYKSQLRGKDANINVELTATAARIKPSQLKQVLLAPGALLDTSGKVGKAPVMRSYSEGMDMGSYLNTLPGSRAGTVSKVIQVQEPGYLTKQLVNTSIDQVITIRDCGTNRGQEVDLSNKDHDLANRILAKDVKIGSNRYSSGTTLNSQIISDIRRVPTEGPSIVQVRSPLYCKAKEGVCQVCTGKLPNGEFLSVGHNFGLTSAQALGERSTQMMLSLFHEGGVFDPSKKVGAGDIYQRSAALLRMPSTMGGNPAVVSSYNAKVRDVEPNKIKGGFDLKLDNGKTIYVRNGARAPDGKTSVREWYNKNPEIKSGQPLTDGLANPREILDKTGDIDQVRAYMTREIGGLFAPTGVLQRNVESMVRGLTQTVEVTKPGGTGLLPGERISLVQAEELVQKHPKFKYKSVLRGVDVAPRELREDFMAQMNYNSVRRAITDSAAIGAESDIHGTNPIPGFAYGREFNRQSRFGPPSKEGRY